MKFKQDIYVKASQMPLRIYVQSCPCIAGKLNGQVQMCASVSDLTPYYLLNLKSVLTTDLNTYMQIQMSVKKVFWGKKVHTLPS